jgi:hypothetical protein
MIFTSTTHQMQMFALVMTVLFYGFRAMKLQSGSRVARSRHLGNILGLFHRDTVLHDVRSPSSDIHLKKMSSTHAPEVSRNSRCSLQTQLSNVAIVTSLFWSSALSCSPQSSSNGASILLHPLQTFEAVSTYLCIHLGKIFRFLASSAALKLMPTIVVLLSRNASANACGQFALELARHNLAAASLPSGLVFFAGGSSGAHGRMIYCYSRS